MKNKSSTIKNMVLLIVVLSITACSWFEGPAGPPGKDGVANIIIKEFMISSSNSQGSDGIAINAVEMPEITKAVYERGTIKLEVNISDRWFALPWTLSSDYSDDLSVDETVELTYGYEEGFVYIAHISSYSSIFESQIEEGPYKIVIIPPSDTTSVNDNSQKVKGKAKDHFLTL